MGKRISDTTPGCTVGIRHNGAEVQRAYGQADLERHVANTTDSVFNIASASKQITAAAVLLLANEGKLSLDDDVRKYLPELPAQVRPITIDQLLSHTSGLRDYRVTDWKVGRDELPQNNNDVLAFAMRQRALNHLPGESHSYTNTGYVLAALIVERVSGRTFSEFTRERLFKPAGMDHTQWDDNSRRIVPNRSLGYAQVESGEDGKPRRFEPMPSAREVVGNGGVLTTIGDMLRWNAALSSNSFGPKLTAQLEQPARLRNGFELKYARGLFVGDYRGHREVQHGGYNGTYTSWVGRYPGADLSIAMLCNGDGNDVDPHDIANLFLPKTPQEDTPDPKAPASHIEDWSGHTGVYRNSDTGQHLYFSKQAKVVDGRAVVGPGMWASTYELDSDKRMVQRQYGNAQRWTRLPEWKPSAAKLSEFQGRFASDELLASYNVAFDGKQLTMSVAGLSKIAVSLQPQSQDVFEADGFLVAFKRDSRGWISGLALAPDQLHEIPFEKVN